MTGNHSSDSSTSSHFKLTEGGGRHGLGVDGWLGVGSGEVWPGVVPALVVVVLDVEAGELGEADPQGAAGVVDVLPVQRLDTNTGDVRQLCFSGTSRRVECSYQFGVLSRHSISVLDQSLELVVLCESDDFQHGPKLGENLRGKVVKNFPKIYCNTFGRKGRDQVFDGL